MNIINGIGSLQVFGKKKFGIAIGNFDGFHLGHQTIISKMLDHCKKQNMILVIMTFVPHPRIILQGAKQFLINDYKNRRKFMQESGLEILCEVEFTRQFSNLNPEEFLDDCILKEKRIKCFFLGHDFSFGKGKKGDRTFVEKYCLENNISVEVLDEFKKGKEKIFSSHIRNLLKQGNIKKANRHLGREFFLEGRVVNGLARGKKIGFPTANLNVKEDLLVPGVGVFSTKVIYGDEVYLSLTNIGFNPTFKGLNDITIETHILDFEKNIYGEEIKVVFIERIREEKKFLSFSDLKKQIKDDIAVRRSQDF